MGHPQVIGGLWCTTLPIGFFQRPYKEVSQFLNIVSDPNNQPVYLFCQGARDRAGCLVLAYRVKIEGCDFESAYQEMREHNFRRWLITLWKTAKEMKEEPGETGVAQQSAQAELRTVSD